MQEKNHIRNNMAHRITLKNKSLFNFNHQENDTKKNNTIGLGVDFGTSNSAAAIFDGTYIFVVKIDNRLLLPSATYLNRKFIAITGQNAIDEYIQNNIGRRVELSMMSLGEASANTGGYDESGLPQVSETQTVYSSELEDSGLSGRLLYGIKQLLADQGNGELKVFNKYYKLEALITPILLRIHNSLIKLAKENFDDFKSFPSVTIGHPVNFERRKSAEKDGNKIALERLKKSFNYAGFGSQKFCTEPVAAAISYLSEKTDLNNETLLIVDFGGGTLDLCILTVSEKDFNIIVTNGIGLGGNHIDQKLFEALIFPKIGKGISSNIANIADSNSRNFHFSEYETLLANWPISYMLNQNEYLTPILNLIEHTDNNEHKIKLQRLLDLIQFNYSYLVLQHLKDLKEDLSFKEEAFLDVPELDLNFKVTQSKFNTIIHEYVCQFEDVIQSTLEKAKLDSTSIDRVICVGGSSQIPAMQNILQKHFPDRIEDHEIFTSVAAGLAVHDYYH